MDAEESDEAGIVSRWPPDAGRRIGAEAGEAEMIAESPALPRKHPLYYEP